MKEYMQFFPVATDAGASFSIINQSNLNFVISLQSGNFWVPSATADNDSKTSINLPIGKGMDFIANNGSINVIKQYAVEAIT